MRVLALRSAAAFVVGLGMVHAAQAAPKSPAGASAPSASAASPPVSTGTAEPSPAPESEDGRRKANGRAPSVAPDPAKADVVSTAEGDEGVKTYTFGAVEVEGRLRSPQIIYFLRRVRAQFEAVGLGHRSFLRELSDTRRDPAFR